MMAKDYETCKWKSALGAFDNARFEVQCNHNPLEFDEVPNNFSYQEFKFCPFCGRKIQWI